MALLPAHDRIRASLRRLCARNIFRCTGRFARSEGLGTPRSFLSIVISKRVLSQMKAIQITQSGGPEVMSIREVPTPVPGPGEVLIRVAASGVYFIDLYVREGRYANP